MASLSKETGGPAYSVPSLCAALKRFDAEVSLHCIAEKRSLPLEITREIEITEHAAATDPFRRLFRASPKMRRALRSEFRGGKIVHTHGVWLAPNLYPAWEKVRSGGAKLVHAPRGMLAPGAMSFSSRKKQIVWRLAQKRALQAADCIHATSRMEYEELRELGLRQPIAIIPNGVEVPHVPIKVPSSQKKNRTLLALGRLHPKKGLDELIRAWAQIEAEIPDWCLRIVGPAEGSYDRRLKATCKSTGVKRVFIEGAVYGFRKSELLHSADLLILPTLSENFGIVVAEALAHGTPVICTQGAPWSGLEVERCGWWVSYGVSTIAATILEAAEMPETELLQMGVRGRRWVAKDYSWNAIGKSMASVYQWLKNEHDKPSTIFLD